MLQKEIINELEKRITKIRSWAESLKQKPESELRAQPAEKSWSALECIDHLNRYNDFYIPVFRRAIENSKLKTSENYKPGWLGKKLAEDMLPKDGRIKSTMKTFKSKNPSLDGIDANALEKFIAYQSDFISILQKCKSINLGGNRVSTTIPMLKLKFGDALRFVVYHQVRHVEQAQRAINKHLQTP